MDELNPVSNPTIPEAFGLYDPSEEHDACGVGLIAAIDGRPTRSVVEAGVAALKALWHRGAVDADGKTGDGAGIHVQIPQDFFKGHVERTGHSALSGRLAVGMVFLPRTDMGEQETCRAIVESKILELGYYIYGWRQVPVDVSVIGDKAQRTRPEIEQIMIANVKGVDNDAFERDLYLIRRRVEKAVLAAHIRDFYVCSLSCRSVIYKGLFLAESIDQFYPDLADPGFVSNFAIYHQRYSTNTFPQWWLAQPFRMLAHNGEINTIRGNTNWMKSHEIRMASIAFGEHSEDIKPLIPSGASDSAALDAVFEALVQSGRNAPMAKTLLVPESWSKKSTMPESYRAMYAYCNSVMEPWDGPAALAATDGRWVIAGMDRNGLRPMRYTATYDGLLVVGSETGMVVVDEERVREKGMLGPGQMIAVDLEEGRFYHDREIKDELASALPYEEWVKDFHTVEDLNLEKVEQPEAFAGEALRQRQMVAGITHEDLEVILHPQVATAKEAIGSMGDDTPAAVLSTRYRNLSHFFRQKFSQVTNPPIDSLRENRIMSLKTRFANFGNVLDKDNPQANVLVLDSPVLTKREWQALKTRFGEDAQQIDCTFDVDAGADALNEALIRVAEESEDAVRAGKVQLFLSDEAISEGRAPIPMILATGHIHTHLTSRGLRTYTSVNVRAAECLDTHYFAVLLGVGATTINAYLAEDSITERHGRGLLEALTLRIVSRTRKKPLTRAF